MPRIDGSPALARFRILDLSRVRAGPTCVRQFADFGADVIKIETPDGEDLFHDRAGSDFQNLHRNKRSITLNLKSAEGREAFMALVKTADVVVENYRPDVKFRLGIDYESLKAVNPRIILASISGFGQDGPYRDRPGFDQIAQGLCGLMSVTGRPGEGPMRAGAAVADVTGGLYAALGIMTALLERETTGQGQWVQSSLLHAGIALLDFQAARYTVSGEVPQQVGNDHPTSMPTSSYATADGWINVAAAGQAMWRKLCEAIGRLDLYDHPDYATAPQRSRNRKALNEALAAVLRTRPSAQWIDELNRAGVPCGPIHAMDQVFADPQVRHLGVATPVPKPDGGTVSLIGQAARLSRTPAQLVSTAPERGAHTDEVLAEAGLDAARIAALRAAGAI